MNGGPVLDWRRGGVCRLLPACLPATTHALSLLCPTQVAVSYRGCNGALCTHPSAPSLCVQVLLWPSSQDNAVPQAASVSQHSPLYSLLLRCRCLYGRAATRMPCWAWPGTLPSATCWRLRRVSLFA